MKELAKTGDAVSTVGEERGAHLFAAIKKQADEGLTIAKALKLRQSADDELDALAKAHSEEHGVGYYDAYEAVTQAGPGRGLMEASLELSRLIANPTRIQE